MGFLWKNGAVEGCCLASWLAVSRTHSCSLLPWVRAIIQASILWLLAVFLWQQPGCFVHAVNTMIRPHCSSDHGSLESHIYCLRRPCFSHISYRQPPRAQDLQPCQDSVTSWRPHLQSPQMLLPTLQLSPQDKSLTFFSMTQQMPVTVRLETTNNHASMWLYEQVAFQNYRDNPVDHCSYVSLLYTLYATSRVSSEILYCLLSYCLRGVYCK